VTDAVDYEGELGIIIGKGGRGIKKEDAWDHVWGATIINDVRRVLSSHPDHEIRTFARVER
jgi:2-keto-4-pentenoate hydratase/2-oxohepta-3-ene-1,7-dioic acid hydratase in catechol pathway